MEIKIWPLLLVGLAFAFFALVTAAAVNGGAASFGPLAEAEAQVRAAQAETEILQMGEALRHAEEMNRVKEAEAIREENFRSALSGPAVSALNWAIWIGAISAAAVVLSLSLALSFAAVSWAWSRFESARILSAFRSGIAMPAEDGTRADEARRQYILKIVRESLSLPSPIEEESIPPFSRLRSETVTINARQKES